MTDREKALAYDKAIERARAYYNSTCFRNTLEALENIFPEIKEEMNKKIKACIEMCLTDANEQRFKDYNTTLKDCLEWLENQEHISKTYLTVQDDKSEEISKEIIKYLEQTVPHHHRDELLKSKEWIAWLKNQNLQKLDNIVKPIFNVGDTVKHKNIEGLECTIESIDDLTYYGNTTNFDIKDQNKWELVEPIDSIAYSKDTVWNESDRLHLGSILSILKAERNNAKVEQYRDSVNSDIDWFKSLKNRIGLSQLNTEDLERINRILDFIWKNRKGDTDEIYQQEQDVKWLKSHKDRIQFQPKQEWSEDDEKMYRGVMAVCNVYSTSSSFYPKENEDIERLKNWLKSLKERCTWKPTDKQIHAFEQVYDWYNNNFAPSETLTSLYNDLKKLYEK